jgi:hypothetical protein
MSNAAKLGFILSYFDEWDRDVQRATELLDSGKFLLESILTLSCYIGALAGLRYPDIRHESDSYPKIVLEYSGLRDFYEQIDLLFFYQWPNSKLREHGDYKALKNYVQIAKALEAKYGSVEDVKEKTRYVASAEIVSIAQAANMPEFDERNLRQKLPLFSLAQILYRYLRCDAVHNRDFPLLNASRDAQGNISYKPNHAITSKILLDTMTTILKNLREECVAKAKWPQEL